QAIVFKVVRDQNSFARGGQYIGSSQKVGKVNLAARHEVTHREFHQLDNLTGVDLRLRGKALMGAMDHVDVDLRDRAKAPSFHQNGPLPKDLRRLQHFSGWTEHCRAAEAQLHEFQTHYSIV